MSGYSLRLGWAWRVWIFAALGSFGSGQEDIDCHDCGFSDLLVAVEFLQVLFAGEYYVRVEIDLLLA